MKEQLLVGIDVGCWEVIGAWHQVIIKPLRKLSVPGTKLSSYYGTYLNLIYGGIGDVPS